MTAMTGTRRRSARTRSGEDGWDAALAERGMRSVLADALTPHPAALALLAARAVHADHEARDVLALVGDGRRGRGALEIDARHQEERREQIALGLEQCRQILRRARDPHGGFQRAPDELLGARRLERLGDFAAHLKETVPVALERVVEPLPRRGREPPAGHALPPGAGRGPPRVLPGEGGGWRPR